MLYTYNEKLLVALRLENSGIIINIWNGINSFFIIVICVSKNTVSPVIRLKSFGVYCPVLYLFVVLKLIAALGVEKPKNYGITLTAVSCQCQDKWASCRGERVGFRASFYRALPDRTCHNNPTSYHPTHTQGLVFISTEENCILIFFYFPRRVAHVAPNQLACELGPRYLKMQCMVLLGTDWVNVSSALWRKTVRVGLNISAPRSENNRLCPFFHIQYKHTSKSGIYVTVSIFKDTILPTFIYLLFIYLFSHFSLTFYCSWKNNWSCGEIISGMLTI